MKGASCPAKRRARYTWLLRGAIGFAMLAVVVSTREPLVVIPALLVAVVAFRGCPMCWLFGLFDRGANAAVPAERKETS